MRKLGKKFVQKGLSRQKRKSTFQLLSELSNQKKTVVVKGKRSKKTVKKITKKQLAKELGISERTLRSYKWYFATQAGLKLSKSKYDYVPKNPKVLEKKIKAIAKRYKIKQLRNVDETTTMTTTSDLKPIINKKTFDRFKKEFNKKEFHSLLIRANILFYTKDGVFNEWLTFLTPTDPETGIMDSQLKSFAELNRFLTNKIKNNINSKRNIYQYRHSLISFEIVEIIVETTLKTIDKDTKKKK